MNIEKIYIKNKKKIKKKKTLSADWPPHHT